MKSVSPTLHETFPVSCLQVRKWWGWKRSGLKTPAFLSWPRKFIQLLINASRPSNAKHLGNRLSQGTRYQSALLCHLSDPDLQITESQSWTVLLRCCIPFRVPHSLCLCSFLPMFHFLLYPASYCHSYVACGFSPPLRHFSEFRIVGRKYRSDSFRRTSIYIFDKYLPQIISVQYHYLSASLSVIASVLTSHYK